MKEMNQKMENHKFRFSDIMPHSWFYKLKGMSRSGRKHLPSSPKHLSSCDASSSRKLRDTLRLSLTVHHPQASSPPKFSFKRKIKRKTVYKPSPRLKLSSSSLNSHVSLTSSRNYRSRSFSANAISVGSSSDPLSSPHSIDIKFGRYTKKLDDVSEDPSISANSSPARVETVKEPPFEMRTQQKLNKSNAGSSGMRIRGNSPKIARNKKKGRATAESKKKEKKGVAENFALVLSSVDPERDFRESMVEMIMENKMKEEKDLEDLLACYLSRNSSDLT